MEVGHHAMRASGARAHARHALVAGLTASVIATTAFAPATQAAAPVLTFAPPVTLPSGSHTHGVVMADVDGDTDLDLIAANAGSDTASVWLGAGDGTFGGLATFPTGTTPKMVAVGDLDGDDHPDLVSANQDADTVSVLLGDGAGGFAAKVDHAACNGTHEVALGDLDGDDDLDVVAACWGGLVNVLLGNGDGTLGPKVDVVAGSAPHSVVLGRFDADAFLDAAVANHGNRTVSLLMGKGDGTFETQVSYAVGTRPHSIRAGDLDGNGTLDLVTANDGSHDVSVLSGNGDGTFAAAVAYPTGQVPKGVAIADVSGDGILDVLTANTAGSYPTCCKVGGDTISVLRGSGTGTFGTATTHTVGLTPFSIATGDLDGDGDLDVATADWHSNAVTVLISRASDETAPVVGVPSVRVGTGTVAATSMRLTISWTADDDDSGLARFDIRRRVDGGTAALLATASAATRSVTVSVVPGHRYEYTIEGIDLAGNRSAPMSTGELRPTLYAEGTSLATYAGTWTRATSATSIGGATKTSSRIGASMTYTVSGRALAWVAPKGSRMGRAKVYVDGVYKGTINLYQTASSYRQVAFQYAWPTSGSHTLKLVLVGPASHPRVDVDGLIVVR